MSGSRLVSLALAAIALLTPPGTSAEGAFPSPTGRAEGMTSAQARVILGIASGKGSGAQHSPGTKARRAWKVRRQHGHGGAR